MNQETKQFVEGLILKNNLTLPKSELDLMSTEHYHAAPYILRELCTALDIYTEDEDNS